ncbi:NADP-dependent oxidoreductase [Litorivivens sp.]|uniref:NADP-dependent oxidoreductase n=1 Tax=Litorivivens sp. TaxID=2020868 RepID=UPI0035649C85
MPSQVRLKKRPQGNAFPQWRFTEDETPDLEDGQIRLRLAYISIDPGMMGWVTDKRSYIPPVNEGEVMRAFGVGEVVESRSDLYPVGSFATGFTGVQSEAVLPAEGFIRRIEPGNLPLNYFLSALGMPGFTGYFGMSDIGAPSEGDTVVVSACSGAVGSIASQIAKLAGARVIGIAGGPEKCKLLTEQFGLEGAIDYKSGSIKDCLREQCPNGIDVYFDNVGGEILDTVLTRMNYKGRVVLCGGISQYGDMDSVQGPKNYLSAITHSLTLRGFTMQDYLLQIPEAVEVLTPLVEQRKLRVLEHVVEGLQNFPEAFEMIFAGRNLGKLMLKVEQ